MQKSELLRILVEADSLSKVQAEVAMPDTPAIGERTHSKMLTRLPSGTTIAKIGHCGKWADLQAEY